jgi:hypothetical protein
MKPLPGKAYCGVRIDDNDDDGGGGELTHAEAVAFAGCKDTDFSCEIGPHAVKSLKSQVSASSAGQAGSCCTAQESLSYETAAAAGNCNRVDRAGDVYPFADRDSICYMCICDCTPTPGIEGESAACPTAHV